MTAQLSASKFVWEFVCGSIGVFFGLALLWWGWITLRRWLWRRKVTRRLYWGHLRD
jgi:hypothetical protein